MGLSHRRQALDSHIRRVVDVRGGRGELWGKAFYSHESLIALRMLTTRGEDVDSGFWGRKLEGALRLREEIGTGTEAYRWINGESDGIPSLIIDRYGNYVVLQTLSQGTERLKEAFLHLTVDLVQPKGILERNDPKVRALEGLPLVKRSIHGDVPRSMTIREHITSNACCCRNSRVFAKIDRFKTFLRLELWFGRRKWRTPRL